MKLVALWVEDYMKFKDQTFNLDHPTEFIFDFDNENRKLSISLENTKGYVQMFDDPFVSVTAIVGKNGAGKSSFLKLLNVINSTKPLDKPVVLVFQNLEKSKQPFYKIIVYQHDDYLFDDLKGKHRKIQIELHEKLRELKKADRLELIDKDYHLKPFLKVDVLNYNNVFNDENDKYLNYSDPLNRKSMYQVLSALNKKSLKEYISEYEEKGDKSNQFSDESFNPLNLYFDTKLEERLAFLSKVHTSKKFPKHLIKKVNLPKSIDVWFNYSIFQLLEEKLKDDQFYPKLKSRNIQWLESVNNEQNGVEAFKNRVLLQIINASLYDELFFKNSKNKVLPLYKKFIDVNSGKEKINFQLLNDFMTEELVDSEVFIVNQYNELLEVLNSIVNDLQIAQDYYTLARIVPMFEIEINDQTWSLLKPLVTVNYFGDYSFFNYQFTNLSSGEDALLNQYTEIYKGIQANSREFLMILIDEGELYLHPEWQKEYLSSIIEFVTYYVRKGVKVQLIFTSHSPFILSDLTKHQVLFLKHNNDDSRLGISVNRKDQIETFGANIYDLFNDSFFMKNGFIGEFARQKIDKVFEDLSKGKEHIDEPRKLQIKQIIGIIGEPLIKRQLSKMYDEIYNEGLELDVIDEQMKRLQKLREKIARKGK
jgi:predicted ATP-binding protein involved in virulence